MSKKPAPKRKTRTVRNFPASTFSEALKFAKEVFRVGAGQKIRRLTLLQELGKSPTSSTARQAITNSSKYGLTTGSYNAEWIELTELGLKSTSDRTLARERERAKIEASVLQIAPFKGVYESLIEAKLPANSVLIDKIKEFDVADEAASEAVETLIVNLRDVGLLKTIAGAERIISVDMRLDELPSTAADVSSVNEKGLQDAPQVSLGNHSIITSDRADYETTAFYVSPIGAEGSDTRKHADLFASSIVEPALETSKLRLVRADQIDTPGVITRQILDYIIHSRLVVADLSFHNPNVFYELAIRHLMRKPTVQIMRSRESVPFDINQSRTIMIDDSDIYTLVPQIPVYINQISAQVRQALENPDAVDNPISIYYPNLVSQIVQAEQQ
ncbi:hypothetical protein N6L24_11390 [Cognatishimia sp. SS12]|uniref:hypothetical protein n=1 Tax=Cognatishimia sp. SS12 TaxID=2979465 RepID=UPI00232AA9F0|nr:hypothetical protein [Cognatishimia sp. SS12]MDC0738883.1 hypothetical protein [Cognatishimia sp. SS12]